MVSLSAQQDSPGGTRAEPIRAAERIEALDVIRRFALFGILFMNLQRWFRTSPIRYEIDRYPYPGLANQAVEVALEVFFDGKFISLFSLLFAVGLVVQMERADGRGAKY